MLKPGFKQGDFVGIKLSAVTEKSNRWNEKELWVNGHVVLVTEAVIYVEVKARENPFKTGDQTFVRPLDDDTVRLRTGNEQVAHMLVQD